MPPMTLRPAIAALLVLSSLARADDDRYSIDADFPVRIEDAFPVETGGGYLKLIGRYAESTDGHGTTEVQPELAVGVAPRLDVHVFAPFLIGGDDRTGSGSVTVNAQYLALEQHEGDWWPSVGVELGAEFPTGVNAHGVDPSVELALTQTLSWAPAFDAIHANLIWTHNAAADDETERDDGYLAIVGYSRRIAPDTVVIADAFWERTLAKDEAGQGAEVGVIEQLSENVLIAAAVGVGLGDDADRFTATVGVEFRK